MQPITEPRFNRIFEEYQAKLLIYAIRFTDNQSVAEDIVEEAFINLWKKRDESSKIQSLNSYLYRIVHNQCISWLRKNNREKLR